MIQACTLSSCLDVCGWPCLQHAFTFTVPVALSIHADPSPDAQKKTADVAPRNTCCPAIKQHNRAW